MAPKVATPDGRVTREGRRKMTRDQEEAFAWVKERARPRGRKKAALPEAEGARIGEASRPARPARRRR